MTALLSASRVMSLSRWCCHLSWILAAFSAAIAAAARGTVAKTPKYLRPYVALYFWPVFCTPVGSSRTALVSVEMICIWIWSISLEDSKSGPTSRSDDAAQVPHFEMERRAHLWINQYAFRYTLPSIFWQFLTSWWNLCFHLVFHPLKLEVTKRRFDRVLSSLFRLAWSIT